MTLLAAEQTTTRSPPAATALAAKPSRGHLRAVDVVRVITVAGVISVHSVSMTTSPNSHLAGAVISALHVNREIFLLLSAFVLTYAYGRRPSWNVGKFWRRRYWFVLVPYVGWSAIYCGINGGPFSSVPQGLEQFGRDLVTGTARYHLYFLLLSMQLYLVFPLCLRALKTLREHHLALLVTSFAAQALLTSFFMYFPSSSGVLGYWARHPNANLLSYQLYVVAGGIAALHLEELRTWVAAHRRIVATSVAVAFGVGLASYSADLSLAHMSVARASQVFQPIIAVEAIAATVGLFCLGQWVDSLGSRGSARALRVAGTGSDTSFGVYLSHPLILQMLLWLGTATGVLAAIKGAGVATTLAFDAVVLVPLIYAIAAVGVSIARRTPLSLVLTGRSCASRALTSSLAALRASPARLPQRTPT